MKFWAVVQSIDAANGKLVVKTKRGHMHTITLASTAVLTKGGDNEAVTIADIKVGDYLRLETAGDVASYVHVNVRPAE